jgi:hypothetical protein
MRYMLLIANDGKALESPTQLNAKQDQVSWMKAIDDQSRGRFLLRPPTEATTVRVRNGEQLRSDGPFTETKEWIAGVEIIEVDDLDEAIRIASTHPEAGRFPIEIRPFWQEED